ncbi:MAG: DUF2934 domain-containing protein [Gammaproteobacteria bacterium]
MATQVHHQKQIKTAKQNAATQSAAMSQAARDVTPEQRHQMIAMTAYLIAEQRGFQGDMALNDWLQAEVEVDNTVAARH